FWAGYFQRYLSGPDWDIIFGSVVLGSAVWLGTVPVRGHSVAGAIALLSFPVACFIGQSIIVGIALLLGVVPDLQANVLQHSIYWIGVGLSMGIIGGWVSGLALRRMLPEAQATSHAASVRIAG
ncbi:MAG: hypothetical protein L0Z53_15585, partial [Acidobacteriales bacterium]|nr:hypothetical protein [Terriglobales bacterium]